MFSLSKYGSALVIGSFALGNACSSTPSTTNNSGSGSTDGGSSSSSGGSSSGSGSGGSSGLDSGGSSGAGDSGPSLEAGLVTGVLGHPDPTITPPTYPGFTLTVDEEFTQPIDLDNDPIWTWSDGGLDEGDVRFTQSQITFSGGNMMVTCANTPQPSSMSFAENKTIAIKPLTSGEFRSKYNNFRYGRYETRFKPPTSLGNFISTMFVFRTPKTIAWREIDVELTAGDPTTVPPGGPKYLGTNVYWQNGNIGGGFDSTKQDVGSTLLMGIANNQTDFHVYAFEWMPDHVSWYVDGNLVRTKLPATPAANPVAIPELSAKVMFNLWIFNGAAFGGIGTNTYPLVATYDYFRFYKADMETTYPCSPTPTCVTHVDNVRSKNNPNDGVVTNPN